jgi:2-methylisocitrate lyase-like PEP mutase family enzyme
MKANSPAERGARFRAMHEERRAFLIPNPWDAGTARVLESLGFEALATTSAGFAFSAGLADNAPPWEACLANAGAIARSTALPVSADLGNGFPLPPEAAAEAIRRAAGQGLVGASIEDSTGQPDRAQLEREHAAERVRAAVEAAEGLGFPFLVTARAENFFGGKRDLRDAIQRLQAYQEAGAHVLYAPGLVRLEDVAEVVRSVDRPVNVLAGMKGASFGQRELADLGVARISVGSALARAAFGAVIAAGREMLSYGTFGFADPAPAYAELNQLFAEARVP